MKKYFTSLHIDNNHFIATAYDTNTNQEIYKTKPYNTQSKAMEDVNKFLTNQKPTDSQTTSTSPQPFINTAVHKPVKGNSTIRRCCGRR